MIILEFSMLMTTKAATNTILYFWHTLKKLDSIMTGNAMINLFVQTALITILSAVWNWTMFAIIIIKLIIQLVIVPADAATYFCATADLDPGNTPVAQRQGKVAEENRGASSRHVIMGGLQLVIITLLVAVGNNTLH